VLVLGAVAAVILLDGEDGSTRSDSVEVRKPAAPDTAGKGGADTNQQGKSTSPAEPGGQGRDTPATEQTLSAPQVTAKRSDGSVIIRYRYSASQWERLPSRAGLVLAVTGSEQGTLPRNVIFQLTQRSGQRRVDLPQSAGPYLVHAQTLAGEQAQGRPVTIPLP
jgi:hypothetical protein